MKDGSFLVVTPYSIPNSAKCGPDVDLSFKGSNEVLEDFDDEPTMKKKIFYSNKEEGGDYEAEFIGMYLSYFVKSPPFPSLFFNHCPPPPLSSPFYIHIYITDVISPYFVYMFF